MFVACSEIIWLHGLFTELGFSQQQPTPLHADNTGAIQIAANPVYHERTKHMKLIVTLFGKPMIEDSSIYHMSQHLFK